MLSSYVAVLSSNARRATIPSPHHTSGAGFESSAYMPLLFCFPFLAPLLRLLAALFPDHRLRRLRSARQVIMDSTSRLIKRHRLYMAGQVRCLEAFAASRQASMKKPSNRVVLTHIKCRRALIVQQEYRGRMAVATTAPALRLVAACCQAASWT